MKMTEGVKNFLHRLGMVKYHAIFSAKGFDLETDIPHITPSDLKDTLMVSCELERQIILSSAQRFKASPEHYVYEWLRRNSLDHYFINFVQSDLLDLETVSKIKLPSEELYDELEIVLPGHRKRLERAVLNLRQEMQRRAVAEKPVTQGWWGKPKCLPQAKFDFLCVEGTLFARHQPNKRVNVDFMVDSGSDVSTVQEETLESLDLELVGPIYSCGIHGGNHTNLYRAQLQIGHEQMTVEVIASNYDSLGSRIIRHFRHVIDGNRHIWLKGNYKDPLPAILPVKIPIKQVQGPQVFSIANQPFSTGQSSKNNILAKTQSLSNSTTTFKVPIPISSSSTTSIPSPHSSNVNKTSLDLHKDYLNSLQHHQANHLSPDINVKCIESDLKNSRKVSESQESCGNINTVMLDKQSIKDKELKGESNNGNCINPTSLKATQDSFTHDNGIGVKRPVDKSSNEQFNANPSLAKIIKLDNNVLDPSHNENLTSRGIVCEKESFPFEGASSQVSGKSSSLLDTDDDVDHMTFTNEEYLSLLSSHLPNSNHHIQSSTSVHFNQSRQGINHSNSSIIHEASENYSVVSTDVVHVHSDEEDEDGGSDFRELSKNFVPGNSTSSVTICYVDLDENLSETTGD